MEHSIRQRLNTMNHEFYRVTAADFDQTRQEAWRGWERLLPYLSGITSVLDVGCGNGRFGVFLAQHFAHGLIYHGIDSNLVLLKLAAEALAKDAPALQVQLEECDIIENPHICGDQDQYELVTLFGVMHHIPGYTERQQFINQLAERVTSGGYLAFACWRFYEFERFRERIIPWDETLKAEIETHDYLLDWRRGEHALRYCHYVDDTEHAALIRAAGLTEISTYRADGQTGTANCYTILKKM